MPDKLTREQRHRCMALMMNRRQTECKQVYLELPRCEPTNEARVETKFTLILPSKEEETQVVRRKDCVAGLTLNEVITITITEMHTIT